MKILIFLAAAVTVASNALADDCGKIRALQSYEYHSMGVSGVGINAVIITKAGQTVQHSVLSSSPDLLLLSAGYSSNSTICIKPDKSLWIDRSP